MFIFRERGREGERERNINMREIHPSLASHTSPAGDVAHNPGMCPDWKLNQQPFVSQVGTQSTEPHQPGPKVGILINHNKDKKD